MNGGYGGISGQSLGESFDPAQVTAGVRNAIEALPTRNLEQQREGAYPCVVRGFFLALETFYLTVLVEKLRDDDTFAGIEAAAGAEEGEDLIDRNGKQRFDVEAYEVFGRLRDGELGFVVPFGFLEREDRVQGLGELLDEPEDVVALEHVS